MLELKDNAYYFGGVPVADLCARYGTPLYVYDTAVMEKQYNKLKNAFNSKTKIKFACKALNNINVMKFFKSLGAGLDTVSIQEVWTGLQAGFDPKDIITLLTAFLWKK